MSENALEVLVDELYKNGIAVEGCEITSSASGESKKVLRTVFELDFTEHDKAFEDKIANLEEKIGYYKDSLSRTAKNCDKLYHENKELKQRIAELEEKNKNLVDMINELQLKKAHIDCDLYDANKRISELESKETETCEKEPISDDCRPSIEWYDNRHQSDCIEINKLNTTIDVLIHKVEYLRQFSGLE